MTQKNHKNENKYVSCIKINGVPILPPLITTTKRKELNKYKQQAIKLENRLKREHELREYINRYYLPKLEETSGIFSESLEHKLSFDTDATLTNTIIANEGPSGDRRTSKLSCDIQVSQYANNEFEVLTNFENLTTHIENIFDNTEAYDKNQSSTSNSASDVSAIDFLDGEHAKPRLIRSDSYVLEAPSPMLLEHMKRNHEIDLEIPNVPTKELGYMTSTPNSSRNDKIKEPEENCDAVNTTLRSEFFSETESELKNISDHSECTQDDITVLSNDLQITRVSVDDSPTEIRTNEEPAKCVESKINETEVENVSIKELSLDTYDEEKLKQILNDIPESYSKQILELLEKQKKEQIVRLNSYMKLKESILESDDLKSDSLNSLHNSLPTQGKYCPNDSYVLSPNNLGLKNGSSDVDVMNCNNKICDMSPKIFTQQCESIVTKTTRCSRQLFSAQPKILEVISKQDWAASIIQAGVRGYLIRRLLRTERVQGLIQTIKDALICAMELHSENTDNINESDVELHRRLIQQVSAACYAFNDVFFTTPLCEQMSLIRIDRERIKEKAKRPKSKLSLRSMSSRSSRNSK